MLPSELRSRFLARAESVELPVRSSIYNPNEKPRYVHFLTAGMASVVTTMINGDGVEVGLMGREGLPESLHLIGPGFSTTACFIQISGAALRMSYDRFLDEFYSQELFRRVILHNVQYTTLLMGQVAACNRLHPVEERLARWLLMVSDRLGTPGFSLTQEFLAEMIGSRRSTVTLTAGLLRRSGLIDYTRGYITILDRPGLESGACECYAITRQLLGTFLKPTPQFASNSYRP